MPIYEKDDMASQDAKVDRAFDRKPINDVAKQEREARGASRNKNDRWASGAAGGEMRRWASGSATGEDGRWSTRDGGKVDSYRSAKPKREPEED